MKLSRWLALAGVILLALYAAIFPLLTIDTLTKIFARAATYPARNLFLLLYLELSRLGTSLIAIVIAITLLVRARDKADARALAVFLLFAVICYEKVFGSNAYPGPVQEHVAESLFKHGVSANLLDWFFGALPWAFWPAAAALLRFSALMPRELDAETLEASGALDRRGFLRGSSVAGADIGAFFRGLSVRIARHGGYRPLALGAAAVVLIALQTLIHATVVTVLLYVVAGLFVALVLTNIRAGHSIAQGADRARITWISEGFVIAVLLFLLSASAFVTVQTNDALMIAFVLIMLTPAAVMVCLALSVLDQGDLDTHHILDRTVRNGTIALAMVLTFGLVFTLLRVVAGRLGMSYALAGLIAVVTAAVIFPAVSRAADAFRLRVLEKPRT